MARKIENQMINAINSRHTWASANTRVVECIGVDRQEVYLHGHMIAKCENRQWSFNLCGWNTRTNSRISALCREFVRGCCGVGTKQGQVTVRYWNGQADKPVNSEGWFTV